MTVIDRSTRSDCIGAGQGVASSHVLDWSTRSDFLVASRAKHQSTYGCIQSNDGSHPKLVPSKKTTSLRGFGDGRNRLDNLPELRIQSNDGSHPKLVPSKKTTSLRGFGDGIRLNNLPELSALNNFQDNPREKQPPYTSSSHIPSNEVITPRRTSSMTNLTDAAVKQGPTSHCPSTFESSPKTNIPKQIPLYTLRMLKQEEQMLLKKKSSRDHSFSPSISTFATSHDESRKMLGKIHPIPSNRSIKSSSRDLGDKRDEVEVKTVGSVEIDGHAHSQRGTCKKAMVIVGLFALLLGIGFGGYFVFLHTEDDTDNNKEASGTSGELYSDASTTIESNDVLVTPPTDLEAQCSASNLPGSLSECLISCLPSACCYPDFTGETCSDNDLCSSYKPHCDVIFDPWSNGPEGVLRDVTDDIRDTCYGSNSDNSKQKTSTLSVAIKRLRGQHMVETNNDDSNQSRDSLEHTCEQFCAAAKCCNAPIILDPSLSGLVLSRYGVYNDASSGEYVMTNCQISNTENVELCSKYQELCSTDEELESISILTTDKLTTSPSLESAEAGNQTIESVNSSFVSALVSNGTSNQPATTPISSLHPSIITTTSPSLEPTEDGNPLVSNGTSNTSSPNQTTTTPTFTPHPSITTQNPIIPTTAIEASAIQESCASDEATLLIRTGDSSARAQCMHACRDGLCCFTDELELLMDSCYPGNEHKCSHYASCLILKDGKPREDGNKETIDYVNVTITGLNNATLASVNVSETLFHNYTSNPPNTQNDAARNATTAQINDTESSPYSF